MNVKFPETNYVSCKFPKVTGRNGEFQLDPTSKSYVYELLPGMPKPHVGDAVVTSCINGFQVCIVTEVNVTVPKSWVGKDMAYVVDFVDLTAYQDCLDRKAKKEALKTELYKMKKEMDEQFALDMYAEKDPKFKELLEAYRSL